MFTILMMVDEKDVRKKFTVAKCSFTSQTFTARIVTDSTDCIVNCSYICDNIHQICCYLQ